MAGIESLIGNAYEKSWEDNYKRTQKPNIDGYYTLKSQASIGGKSMAVGILVEKDNQGHFHYDFLLDDSKTKTALDSAVPASLQKELSAGGNLGLTCDLRATPPATSLLLPELSEKHRQVDFAALDAASQAEHNGFSINMLVGDASPSGDMGVSSRPH